MTDLPRFYDGAVGKLDFTTMNEMMKRLDLLLPLVQNAAGGGGWVGYNRPTVFPVYAERSAFRTDDGAFKYHWWEITFTEDRTAWEDEETADEGQTQLRKGVATDGGGVDYGLLPYHPRDDAPEDPFQEGFAIAVVIKSANTDAKTGGVRCVLFPLAVPGSTLSFVQITGTPTVVQMPIGFVDRAVREYPATLLKPEPDEDGGPALAVADDDVFALDLNDPASQNVPTVEGSDPVLTPRPYDVGTIFQATKIGDKRYAFTHLIRFDVTCS